MPLLDWPFLDALQAGALLMLFVGFGSEGLARRDRIMAWLALTCLLVALRHGLLALGTLHGINPDLLDRGQSLLIAAGFLCLCASLKHLFPDQVPGHFPGWMTIALAPNYLRNLVFTHPSLADTWSHQLSNAAFLLGCGCILTWIFQARQLGNPMARRLFLAFMAAALLAVVELLAFSLFNLKIRLSGFSLVILALAMGTSWQWLLIRSMETRIHRVRKEAEAWQSLFPGNTFRTDRPSPLLENLLGQGWADQVKAQPEGVLLGTDGFPYRVRSRILHQDERLGWVEREDETQPGAGGFLSGWSMALGMDDLAQRTRLQALLEGWGAQVTLWGTVPPREGPFPSVLIWGREPSILAVWREHDLQRRRPAGSRWAGPPRRAPMRGWTRRAPRAA